MEFVTVIPAAGRGHRAGGYKPLWALGESTVIDRIINAASATCSEIRVVGGFQFKNLKKYLKSNRPEVKVLYNRSWKKGGMFSSVQTALNNIDNPTFIHPADIPGPGAEIYEALASAFEKHQPHVVRPVYHGRSGHPILLSPSAIRAVQEAQKNTNLRTVLSPFNRFDVVVEDDLILYDFDTLEQFENLKARLLI